MTTEVSLTRAFDAFSRLEKALGEVIVGQKDVTRRTLIALLSRGNVLLEGVPGLGKTLLVRTLSHALGLPFSRIQFTPDLMPTDIIGTNIIRETGGDRRFEFSRGPLFANIVLADEINRATPKTQSALLEAMEERTITVAGTTYVLAEPFIVLATQNPIEMEGTYPLPEAQIDRFMLKINITYPNIEEEHKILKRMGFTDKKNEVKSVVEPQDILRARSVVDEVYMDEKIEKYILDIVFATREPQKYKLNELSGLIQYGASPRASIYLTLASKAYAFIQGRGYVTPQDVKSIGPDVLRHRVIVSYEAEAEEKSSDDIIKKIFNDIEVP